MYLAACSPLPAAFKSVCPNLIITDSRVALLSSCPGNDNRRGDKAASTCGVEIMTL